MSTAAEILLIIVSAVLVIFLLVLIAAAYYFISVMRDLKRISQKAEGAASAIEMAAEALRKASTPLAVLKLINSVVKRVKKLKKE